MTATGIVLLGLAACSTDRRLLAPDPGAELVSPEKKDDWRKTSGDSISPTPVELARSQEIWESWCVVWKHYYGWEGVALPNVLEAPEDHFGELEPQVR